MMALGGRVNGGLYGTAPSLNPDPSNPTLENNAGDVRFETDFRSVYAQVIDNWLGADSVSILGGTSAIRGSHFQAGRVGGGRQEGRTGRSMRSVGKIPLLPASGCHRSSRRFRTRSISPKVIRSGHASRSCLIGMRIARRARAVADDQSHLFYALLLKDAGCSSNSARVFQLFGGDDQKAKRGAWMRDWRKLREQIAYVLDYAEPDGRSFERLRRLAVLAAKGPASRRMLFEVRCDRGAEIARTLGFSQATAAGDPLHGRALGRRRLPRRPEAPRHPAARAHRRLAQVAEIFASEQDPARAVDGRAAAPRAAGSIRRWSTRFSRVASDRVALGCLRVADRSTSTVAQAEPEGREIEADERRLDDIAVAFAWVIDAKSPYTYHHSERVADFAVGDRPARWARRERARAAATGRRCCTTSAS